MNFMASAASLVSLPHAGSSSQFSRTSGIMLAPGNTSEILTPVNFVSGISYKSTLQAKPASRLNPISQHFESLSPSASSVSNSDNSSSVL